MKIRPDRQEKLFLGHLAVVTILVFLASGSSQLADAATFALRVLTYPINLILNHHQWFPAMPMDAILERPSVAYGIAAVIVPFIVINSYLWAFVICHIKWSDDPKAVYEHVAQWSEFLELQTTPVLEDNEAAEALSRVYGR